MKTLVLGLGNSVLRDDSVGLRVARAVGEIVIDPDVTAEETPASGLALLDSMAGYDRVIIVDAIRTREGRPGEVYRLGLADIDTVKHTANPHDATLTDALDLGRKLGMSVPREIVIIAIEITDNCESFGEECSDVVEKAIPLAAQKVIAELS